MQQEGEIRQQCRYPHEGKHLAADITLDVQLVLRRQSNLGGHANDGGYDGRYGEDNAGHGANEGGAETEPAGLEDQWCDEEKDEVEDDAGHEEGVHDLRSNAEEGEDGGDFGRQSDSGAGEEFANKDRDRIEPEEGFGRGAESYAFIVVALAITPHANLVKVMKTEAPGHGIEQV